MTYQLAASTGLLEIGTEVLTHLMRAGLSGTEWSLTFAVIQRAKSRGGMAVTISLREFRDLVGLDQEAIRKGLRTLRDRNILVRHETPTFTKPASWEFNEDWQSWTPSGSRGVLRQHTPLQQHAESPTPARRGVLSQHTLSSFSSSRKTAADPRDTPPAGGAPASASIDNIQKHVYRFEKNKSSPAGKLPTSKEASVLAAQLRDAVRVRDPKSRAGKTEDLSDWAREIEMLMSADQRTPDEIRRVIAWCQSPGSFWGPHILSGQKLREKFDTLSGLMVREKCNEARYERLNGNYRVPQILNNRAEREYVPVKEPVRILILQRLVDPL